jgi:hypothetical protein
VEKEKFQGMIFPLLLMSEKPVCQREIGINQQEFEPVGFNNDN